MIRRRSPKGVALLTIEQPVRLSASVMVPSPDPAALRAELARHLGEHVLVETTEGGAVRLSSELGSSLLTLDPAGLRIDAESHDATSLAYIKLIMAEHLLELGGAGTPIRWVGAGAAGSPLPFFRAMTVTAVEAIGRFRRLTLRGDDLGRFAVGGLHVRLLLPPEGHRQRWPVTGADGRPAWPDNDPPPARVYTLRRIDVAAGEVEIDMLLHASHGDSAPGSDFAARARPGEEIGMTGPGGGDLPDASDYMFFADETALPAVARLLKEMPAGRRVRAFVEIEDAADRQVLPSAADVDLVWLHRQDGESLAVAAAAVAPDRVAADCVVWGGMEHGVSRALRRLALDVWGLPRDRLRLASYWRRGRASGDHHHDD